MPVRFLQVVPSVAIGFTVYDVMKSNLRVPSRDEAVMEVELKEQSSHTSSIHSWGRWSLTSPGNQRTPFCSCLSTLFELFVPTGHWFYISFSVRNVMMLLAAASKRTWLEVHYWRNSQQGIIRHSLEFRWFNNPYYLYTRIGLTCKLYIHKV